VWSGCSSRILAALQPKYNVAADWSAAPGLVVTIGHAIDHHGRAVKQLLASTTTGSGVITATGTEQGTCLTVGLDMGLTTGQTDGMSVKVGISLPDRTHARAVEHARSTGTTLSGLIDAALRAELTRREVADHVAMLAEADDADRLHARARTRSRALSAWKSGR
jgi:hypothetical protein